MTTLENKLKAASFWLRLCVINQLLALAVIAVSFVYSVFTGESESMKEVLSIYAFTLLTPQIAIEVILLLGLFMVSNSLRELRENLTTLVLFIVTFVLLILFIYLR